MRPKHNRIRTDWRGNDLLESIERASKRSWTLKLVEF